MSKQRVYLDTSVISAIGDERAPDRQRMTQEFFARRAEFDLFSSELTKAEIQKTRDPQRLRSMLDELAAIPLLPVSAEAVELSSRYIAALALPEGAPEDALHVAIAVLSRQDVILSWNYKHLVNQRRRALLDSVNVRFGLPRISILTPPEL